jgi:TPR repeat protein
VLKDAREAARLYKLAADQGDARAKAALTRLDREQQQRNSNDKGKPPRERVKGRIRIVGAVRRLAR